LIDRAPCQEAGSRSRPKHPIEFAKCTERIRKKHDAEAAGGEMEGVLREGEMLRIGNVRSEIGEPALARAPVGDIEQVLAEIESRNVAARSDRARKTDGRLPGAACQIQNLHAGPRVGKVDQSLGRFSSHDCGFRFPLLGGDQPVGRAPVTTVVFRHTHDESGERGTMPV
jgi:hypothetical protein